jgi:ubiquinone/menaquinone biosynthesis C-methylase UbiE
MNDQEQWRQWQMEGNIPDAYEKYLVPIIFTLWGAKLIELSELALGEQVLDVACGTGIIARLAAKRVGGTGKIVGLDLNPGMLAVARSATADISPTIEWQEGSATDLPFADDTFDAVFCQFSLQYFPDRLLALQQMRRVLKSGGRILLNLPRPIQYHPSSAILAKALERHVGSEVAEIMNAPFTLGDAEEIRTLFADAGFNNVRIRIVIETFRAPSPEEYVWRQMISSPLAGPFSKIDDATRSALFRDVTMALQSYVDDDGLVHPTEAHFVVARK